MTHLSDSSLDEHIHEGVEGEGHRGVGDGEEEWGAYGKAYG